MIFKTFYYYFALLIEYRETIFFLFLHTVDQELKKSSLGLTLEAVHHLFHFC